MSTLEAAGEFFDGAVKLIKEKKFAEAKDRLDRMLGRFPREQHLLFLAGTVRVQLGEYGTGIVLLERALDLGEKSVELLCNLGNAYRMENNTTVAELYFGMAAAQPDAGATVFGNRATCYINEGCPERAIELCDKALAMQPDDDLARFNRSLAYLELGRWKEGFADYAKYSLIRGERRKRDYSLPNRPCPEWNGSTDKTIVVHGEQGLGDEVMFASCIPDAIAISKQVIVDCDPRVEPLFRRSFPQAQVHGTTPIDDPEWRWWHSIDASIGMGGLPQYFRCGNEMFPGGAFLKADAWQTQRWRERLAQMGPKPKIGISWIGGLKKTRIEQRSIPLADWKPILDLPCDFISLQWHEESPAEAQANGVHVFRESMECFDFCASLMAACDLVISVVNTNVHLAGALGVPCWCLTPCKPPWVCNLKGEDMIWYRSVKQYRAQTFDWSPVLTRIAADLMERFSLKVAA